MHGYASGTGAGFFRCCWFLYIPVVFYYNMIYATLWIFPPLAFYRFNLIMGQLQYRMKDAWLLKVDNQMTPVCFPSPPFCAHTRKLTITIPATPYPRRTNRTASYRPTPAPSVYSSRGCSVFEVHPLSIVCTLSASSCLQASDLDQYSTPAPISLSFSLCHQSKAVR